MSDYVDAHEQEALVDGLDLALDQDLLDWASMDHAAQGSSEAVPLVHPHSAIQTQSTLHEDLNQSNLPHSNWSHDHAPFRFSSLNYTGCSPSSAFIDGTVGLDDQVWRSTLLPAATEDDGGVGCMSVDRTNMVTATGSCNGYHLDQAGAQLESWNHPLLDHDSVAAPLPSIPAAAQLIAESLTLDVISNGPSNAATTASDSVGKGKGTSSSMNWRGKAVQSQPRRLVKRNEALKCPYPECEYPGTFPREYELRRHTAAKHSTSKSFGCPVMGCFKGNQRTVLSRFDKLTDHLRSAHSLNTTVPCPYNACSGRVMELDLLAIHIVNVHYWDYLKNNENSRAIVNAASPRLRKCPLWHCRKQVSLQNFLLHLKTHSEDELEGIADDLFAIGYSVSRSPTAIGANQRDSPSHGASNAPMKVIKVVCPICKDDKDDHEAFANHMVDTHLFGDQHKTHYREWHDHVAPLLGKNLLDPTSPWWVLFFNKGAKLECPHCSWSEGVDYGDKLHHHLTMLQDPTELIAHRRQILRLYPDFVDWTQVWVDLA